MCVYFSFIYVVSFLVRKTIPMATTSKIDFWCLNIDLHFTCFAFIFLSIFCLCLSLLTMTTCWVFVNIWSSNLNKYPDKIHSIFRFCWINSQDSIYIASLNKISWTCLCHRCCCCCCCPSEWPLYVWLNTCIDSNQHCIRLTLTNDSENEFQLTFFFFLSFSPHFF